MGAAHALRTGHVVEMQEGGAGDQCQVGEGLREVAQVGAGLGVDLLGVEADIVGMAQEAVEQGAGVIRPIQDQEGIDQPEAGDQECALAAVQAVVAMIAIDQVAVLQLLLDVSDGRGQDLVRDWQAQHRDLQECCVGGILPERLNEVRRIPGDALFQNGRQDRVLLLDPVRLIAEQLARPVQGDPGHRLALGKVLQAVAGFPDALIGLAPDPADMVG